MTLKAVVLSDHAPRRVVEAEVIEEAAVDKAARRAALAELQQIARAAAKAMKIAAKVAEEKAAAAANERNRRIFNHKNNSCWEDREDQVRRLCRDSSMIVLNIDGACSKNGRDGAEAAYGVTLRREDGVKGGDQLVGVGEEEDEEEEADEKVDFDGVLVISDSAYSVNGITDWVWTWAENG
ncbi:hypothetical protein BDZ45DRAFT_751198 [Acephala macrosclerotiorum]|nr:hypothetical protein BDZ45DRAFT_751198 [Acephala macrosclerotiorum]